MSLGKPKFPKQKLPFMSRIASFLADAGSNTSNRAGGRPSALSLGGAAYTGPPPPPASPPKTKSKR